MLLAACLAAAFPSHARTPLGDAAQALLSPEGNLRFVTYGETDLAPVKIFRDASRTYIQLGKQTGQRVDALEVTGLGYRRLPTHYTPPYLVVGGFTPTLALSYPGRPLVFIEFAPEALRQPASPAELTLRMQERTQMLLQQQTRLEAAERDVYDRARAERARAEDSAKSAQQQLAAAQQARADARAEQQQFEAQRTEVQQQKAQLAAERDALAKRPPQRAFDVYRADGTLKDVLTRWARNDGLDLQWSAPDDQAHNPQVGADGPVDAKNLKEAMHKLLQAFRSDGLALQATFYSDGIVEITHKDEK